MINLLYKICFYKRNDFYIRDEFFFYIEYKINKRDIDRCVKISFVY